MSVKYSFGINHYRRAEFAGFHTARTLCAYFGMQSVVQNCFLKSSNQRQTMRFPAAYACAFWPLVGAYKQMLFVFSIHKNSIVQQSLILAAGYQT